MSIFRQKINKKISYGFAVGSKYVARIETNKGEKKITFISSLPSIKESYECIFGLAIPDDSVITKILTLPGKMSELQIEQHIKLEAKYYFGLTNNELYFDFKILTTKNNYHSVYIIAARCSEVLKFKMAYDVNFAVISVESLVLARALQFLLEKNEISFIYLWQEKLIFGIISDDNIFLKSTKISEPTSYSSLLQIVANYLDVYLENQLQNIPHCIYSIFDCNRRIKFDYHKYSIWLLPLNKNLLKKYDLPRNCREYICSLGAAL